MSESMKELVSKLETRLEAEALAKSGIVRSGEQIIIPHYMTFGEAARAIHDAEKQLEEHMEKEVRITGHPDDLLNAFYEGLKGVFGQVLGHSKVVRSFFGSQRIPGQSKTIKTGFSETKTVPYGNVKIPGFPVGIEISLHRRNHQPLVETTLRIYFSYLSKHESYVERLEGLVREKLQKESIFLHKAIDSRFNFLDLSDGVTKKLVHSANEHRQLSANIYRFIQSTDSIQKLGVRIKRTVLLTGEFGTGKSLTALRAAQKCVNSGWTFLNVVPGDDIVQALHFAEQYQPCVVFFEDIDQVTSEERGERINTLLNTIDGILSKSSKVLTILTTNNPHAIERAMLRSGRIDAVIRMGEVDRPTLKALIEAYVGNQLAEDLNLDLLMKAAEGYPPAFIAGGCELASLYALDRAEGRTKDVRITNDDLDASFKGLREQFEMMKSDRETKVTSIDSRMEEIVGSKISLFRSAVEAEQCANCG